MTLIKPQVPVKVDFLYTSEPSVLTDSQPNKSYDLGSGGDS